MNTVLLSFSFAQEKKKWGGAIRTYIYAPQARVGKGRRLLEQLRLGHSQRIAPIIIFIVGMSLDAPFCLRKPGHPDKN